MRPLELDRVNSMAEVFKSVNVVVSDLLPCEREWRQVHFPKSRSKRIRKKWAKDRRNWKLVDVEAVCFQLNGQTYVNSLGFAAIKRGFGE